MHTMLPLLCGVVLVLGSSIGLLAALRQKRVQRRSHAEMTVDERAAIQATSHYDVVHMVHTLNEQLATEGKSVSERIIFDLLDLDPKEVYDQQEGQRDA